MATLQFPFEKEKGDGEPPLRHFRKYKSNSREW
jgi:hypothetical protein